MDFYRKSAGVSTGSAEVPQEVQNFYRKFRTSTGSSVIPTGSSKTRFQAVGELGKVAWMARGMVDEVVMAQQQ